MVPHSLKLLLAGLLLAASLPAFADPYKDLPGVKDPTERERSAADDIVCTSQLVRQRPMSPSFERNGLAYRAYSCNHGRIRTGSSQEPDMIDYRKSVERSRAD